MMKLLEYLENGIVQFSNWLWGLPLLFLLTGGGLFFLIYSRFIPYRYFFHAIKILMGKYDTKGPGQLSSYQALSTAIASTVGMGNIAGVAVAISIGGPGAIFWMWVSAFVGMATNFFTCAQASMFRGKDSAGEIQGGPMYVIVEGMGKAWRPLAVLFCVCCLFGTLAIFQANQLTQAILNIGLQPFGVAPTLTSKFVVGFILTLITALVVIGGIQRIGQWAGRMVPVMIALYFVAVFGILVANYDRVPHYFKLIVTNAFTAQNYHGDPDPITGGIVGGLIILGVRRASFSNEAGIGTSPLAMGTTKSTEPIREGLVAMLSPAIDTLLVCTCTALAILVTGVWQTSSDNGVLLTANAFNSVYPGIGSYLLMICILFFAITSMFSYCYYGTKSLSFLVGVRHAHYYIYFYLVMIVVGAVASLASIISLIDAAYALMALPTMVSGIVLAPRVMRAAKDYFERMRAAGEL